MPTPTVEQYVKTIYQLSVETQNGQVNMTPLANAMGVTPGTATTMAKSLADRDLVDYVPRHGVQLTRKGLQLAVRIVRRHRLIETFLERVLAYDWSEVHAEAEKLEHAISDLFVERVDALLGNPSSDPHGDPIPDRHGHIADQPRMTLAITPPGETVTVHRLLKDESGFLTAMDSYGIRPGSRFLVSNVDEAMGTVTIVEAPDGSPVTLGIPAAALVLVRPAV